VGNHRAQVSAHRQYMQERLQETAGAT
jgi:hypothetical protein